MNQKLVQPQISKMKKKMIFINKNIIHPIMSKFQKWPKMIALLVLFGRSNEFPAAVVNGRDMHEASC